ncbi:MAG: hypothetical protein HY769_04235 [Candidatus Stahlbacteria bacterium]|nr:hypothetical protein [Candidatus Stahlbacteria bacterium]
MKKGILSVLLVGALIVSAEAVQKVAPTPAKDVKAGPHEMNYQGWLGSNDTTGITDTLEMTFSIYGAETGGLAYWTEVHPAVVVNKGIFNVMLGSDSILPIFGGDIWLETVVGTDVLSPRKKIGSVMYALYSEIADMAGFAYQSIYADTAAYCVPDTNYFVVGGEAFVPGANVDYYNTYGNGGAYIAITGSGALVAPVHLPQGAVVTGFKVFFDDNSASDMTVHLARLNLAAGAYNWMATVSSTSITGYGSGTDESISYATIDNTAFGYHIYAYSTAWDSNLKIMGAVVTYIK